MLTAKERDALVLEIRTIKQNLLIANEKKLFSYVVEQTKRLTAIEADLLKKK